MVTVAKMRIVLGEMSR